MRREWIRMLLAALLLAPASLSGQPEVPGPSEIQCRKRILVFLDVSGSMLPRVRESRSPFRQSLDALERLLNEPGFIESSDVVEVVRFGKRVNVKNRAQGREEIRDLVEMLRGNQQSDLDTDFRVFFQELAKALEESSFYNSQVILLGSDLVHEKQNRAPVEDDLEDWTLVQAEESETLRKIQRSSRDAASVLFVPPPASGDLVIQQTVFRDLQEKEYLPRIQKIASGGGSQRELVAGLIKGLTLPPRLTLSRDDDDRRKLAFIVTNPNCRELRLKSLGLQLGTAEGATSAPINFTVTPEEAALGTTGSPEGTRVISRPIPTGGGWEDLSALVGTVETVEGLVGTTTGTAGSWLKYRPLRGVVEANLPSPVLRLDLAVLGHTEEPTTYELTLRADGQGADDPPLAREKFSAPQDLDAQSAAAMRIVFPVSRDLYAQLDREAVLRVAIAGAEPAEEGGDDVAILLDPAADRSNLVLLIAGLIGIAAVIAGFVRVRNIVDRFHALKRRRNAPPWWIGIGILALLPLLLNAFHLWLLRFWSPLWVDRLGVGLSVAALFVALYFSGTMVQAARFGKKVLTANPPMDHAPYKRQSQRGALVPLTLALAALILLWTFWFFSRPPVSPNLARDTDPPRLRVVSE